MSKGGMGMRRTKWLISLLVAAAVLLCWSAPGGLAGDKEEAKEDKAAKKEASFGYIGAKKCGMCHKKDKSGNQYGAWLEKRHAKAFETLATEEAIAQAKELELGDPQKEPKCLECHATALAVMDDLENQTITLEEGVSCESCHGPGSEYKSMKTMKAIFAGETDGESVGLWTISEKTCMACHDPESPFTADEFDYEKMLAKITHPYPEGYGKEEK
jgi:hypothetical protein